MSFSSSPITRTPPPAERSSQRSERAPAGDFAALLELVPTPARAPVARAGERREPDRGPADAHDDRRNRPVPASPRSRHARPDGGRPAAAPGQDAPRPGHAVGRGPVVAEASPGPTTAGTAAVPGVPASADIASSGEATAPPHDLTGVVGALGTEAPVSVVGTEQPIAPVVPGSPAAPGSATTPAAAPQASTPVFAAPAGSSQGAGAPTAAAGSAAVAGVPAAVAALSEAALGDAVPAVTAAPAPTAPVAGPAVAGAVATEVPATHASPATDVAAATAGAAGAETTHAESGTPAGAEPAMGDLPTGTGTGTGFAGARDGQTGRGSSPEVAEAPAAATAPTTAATGLPGSGRMADAVAYGPHRSVPLERAPRVVAQLLHVASQQGVSHARIALRPVELGGIEIFLQVSPAGLAAQLVAESPEAARMLAQATEDLRRSLAGQNVELVSLEVSTSAEQQQRDDLPSRGFTAEDGMPGGGSTARRGDAGSEPPATSPDLTTPTVIELPDGLLVDVLA